MAAAGGTAFFDEISSLPLESQGKLLRVLETGEVRRVGEATRRWVDLRVVAAADSRLRLTMAEGQFRLDLFQRLAGVVLEIPPLRRRRDDVARIATHYAERWGAVITMDGQRYLAAQDWPGNVRQLRATIERATYLADSDYLDRSGLEEALLLGQQVNDATLALHAGGRDSGESEAEERERLLDVCIKQGWRASAIAQDLGWSRATLFRRLRESGLSLRQRGRYGAL